MAEMLPAQMRYARGLVAPAALITLGVAAIHFSVAPDHLEEYLPFGVLFLVTGFAQAVLAPTLLVRPSRLAIAATALIAIGCIAIFVASRTVGLPVGPSEKDISIQGSDPVTILLQLLTSSGLTGVIASFLELISFLLLCLALLLGPRAVAHPRRWLSWTLPAALPIVALTLVAVECALNPLPVAINMSTAQAGAGTPMSQLVASPGTQPVESFVLTAEPTVVRGRQEWTYNGLVPGPELRVKQGERIHVTLVNHLPASTTIHWHGYPLPNAEDGVAGLTQDAVKPGQSYSYDFVATIPGTYWYHSHQDTEHQVPMGLYGALVVEPATPNPYDIDRAVIIGDADAANAALHIDAAPGQRVRLRVISAYGEDMTGDPEVLTLLGAPYRIVAIDGHDLNGPTELGPERLLLDTGQRYDIAFTMPADGEVRLADNRKRTGSRPIRSEWVDLGSGARPEMPERLPTFDLTHYGTPAPDPIADAASFDVSEDLTISNQVGFRYGSYEFVHMFNGKSFPDTPVILVHEGDRVRLRFINLTDEYHPIHLHGHIMSVVSRNGFRIAGSPVHLDSILVGPHETWEVAFLADNPGLWMIHCHILVHAAYGLSAMVSYQGIWTPYTIGTASGNFPE